MSMKKNLKYLLLLSLLSFMACNGDEKIWVWCSKTVKYCN